MDVGFITQKITVDEGDLGSRAIDLDDTSLNHFVVKIVSFTSTLSDSGEDRVTWSKGVKSGNISTIGSKALISQSETPKNQKFDVTKRESSIFVSDF